MVCTRYTLTAKIFGQFYFRTSHYRPKILLSKNCGDIYEALNLLIESVKMSKN